MRFSERLTGLKNWTYKELCKGRTMKAPAENMDIGTINRQEPPVYLAWAPARVDKAGNLKEIPLSTVPGILIMPNQTYAKYMEEKRFDRHNNVHRPQEMGQHLAVSILFRLFAHNIKVYLHRHKCTVFVKHGAHSRLIQKLLFGICNVKNYLGAAVGLIALAHLILARFRAAPISGTACRRI